MNASRFNALLRNLAQTLSRRTVGRALAAAIAGVALGRGRPQPVTAGAGCFKGHKKCRGNTQCCSLKCHHGRCRGGRHR